MTDFLALHRPGAPLLMPNPWDLGSAKLLESLGFEALASTSSGFAATLGHPDHGVTRDEALAHSAALVEAVGVPVSADLEHCFADAAEGVADTVRLAAATGLAGCSVEDRSRERVYERELAAERVAAAVEAAGDMVITARTDGPIGDAGELAEAIARLQSFQEAGAHVLFAPHLTDLESIRTVVAEIDRPLNVLVRRGMAPIAQLAQAGAARISVGGGFAWVAMGAVVEAARELRGQGTYEWGATGSLGLEAWQAAATE
jgi:2-methylisocitrate lyase-like PEP mutase family enzyme